MTKGFVKNEKVLKTLIQTIIIYSQDKGMEFGIAKCTMLMGSGKIQMTEGIELANQERIKTLGDKKNYNYLKTFEANTIKQAKMKVKITKEYLRGTRNFSKQSSEISTKG